MNGLFNSEIVMKQNQTAIKLFKNINDYHNSFKKRGPTLNYMSSFFKSVDINNFPTKKMEDWKYTNISNFLTDDFSLTKKTDNLYIDSISKYVDTYPYRIIFVDGNYKSLYTKVPTSIDIKVIKPEEHNSKLDSSDLSYDNADFFDQINMVSMHNLIKINVNFETILKNPIVILNLYTKKSDQHFINPRLQIKVCRKSSLTFYEQHIYIDKQEANYFINSSTNFNVLGNSHVEYINLKKHSKSAKQISYLNSEVSENSTFNPFILDFQGKLIRNNYKINLNDKFATSVSKGLSLTKNKSHVDNCITINHNKGSTTSEQLFKGVLDQESKTVFTGKIFIEQNASKSNAKQLNKNLILDKKSTVNSRPLLEIYNDDVKAEHGFATSEVDTEQIFYLQSRGLSDEKAKKLIFYAFSRDIVDQISSPPIRIEANNLLAEILNIFPEKDIADTGRCAFGRLNYI